MRKSLILNILILCSATFGASAQTLSEVLQSVESRNATLQSAQWQKLSEEEDLKGRAMPANPEVEFNYLWGSVDARRHDFRVTQSFDFALLSGQKAKETASGKELLAIEYRAQRQDILLEAEKVCIEMVFNNALREALTQHLTDAEHFVAAYTRKVELGDASVLELNNARLHRSEVSGKLAKAELEHSKLSLELSRLNGGEAIEITETDIDAFLAGADRPLPESFAEYFEQASEQSPALAYVKEQIELRDRQLKVEKASRLPELTLGYMSEITSEDPYRGITFGISIPLWNQSSKVRSAKANLEAAKSQKEEAYQTCWHQLASQYAEAEGLREMSLAYRSGLEEADSREYLKKAQEQGEISVIDYISEIDLFYENLEETLDAECAYRQALAGLNAIYL
jgi:outer membrane protein, heavy metal efflux system